MIMVEGVRKRLVEGGVKVIRGVVEVVRRDISRNVEVVECGRRDRDWGRNWFR